MGELLIGVYVLVLASFVGFEIINKVPPTLHTPLMSGANAISGITIVGALYAARHAEAQVSVILGCIALAMATINVVGGFMVTNRMLAMFGSKKGSRGDNAKGAAK
ncbi:MAG: NAD(P) transhydrogenase subunit alpha [Myxococcota bacterium]